MGRLDDPATGRNEAKVRCPVCRQWAEAEAVLRPGLRRDALGRRPRKERCRLHRLCQRQTPPRLAGDPPLLIALQHVVWEECERRGISGNMLATLSGVREPTVRSFLECAGKCSGKTLICILDGLGLKLEVATARARRWLEKRARGRG